MAARHSPTRTVNWQTNTSRTLILRTRQDSSCEAGQRIGWPGHSSRNCCGSPGTGTPWSCTAWTGSHATSMTCALSCWTRHAKGCGWSSSKSTGLHKGGLPHGQPDALRHGAFADFERSPIRSAKGKASPWPSTREPNSTAATATSHGSNVIILLLRLGTLESLRWPARQWSKGKIDPAPRIRCVAFVTVASPSEWPSKR